MKNEKQILLKVMKNFQGMNKLDAFDMLAKMEVLLFYATSPLTFKDMKHIVLSDIENSEHVDPFHFTILPNGNFCNFLDSNSFMHVYKEQHRILPDWSIFNSYYYKTKYAPLELMKLNRKNLLESFAGEAEEKKIQKFLRKHKPSLKDEITGRVLILDIE